MSDLIMCSWAWQPEFVLLCEWVGDGGMDTLPKRKAGLHWQTTHCMFFHRRDTSWHLSDGDERWNLFPLLIVHSSLIQTLFRGKGQGYTVWLCIETKMCSFVLYLVHCISPKTILCAHVGTQGALTTSLLATWRLWSSLNYFLFVSEEFRV